MKKTYVYRGEVAVSLQEKLDSEDGGTTNGAMLHVEPGDEITVEFSIGDPRFVEKTGSSRQAAADSSKGSPETSEPSAQ